jgi:hypothetical protein
MHKQKVFSRQNRLIYALVFLLFIVGFTTVMSIIMIDSLPLLIIGSELNGDGTVEYLCLGSDCNNLNRMDW